MPLISVLTFIAVIIRVRFEQYTGAVLGDLAVSDSHDAIDFRLRSFFYCVYGECDVLTSGTRTQAQDVQRDLSSFTVPVDSQ